MTGPVMYVTAEHIPAEHRLMSHTGVIHVRSPMTRGWKDIGTPLCNDARQLSAAPPDSGHGYLCKRCNQINKRSQR